MLILIHECKFHSESTYYDSHDSCVALVEQLLLDGKAPVDQSFEEESNQAASVEEERKDFELEYD